jgi:hypothetical protein
VRDHSEGGAQSSYANRGGENHDGRLSRVHVHCAVVRRAISASRSRMTFTNVALRLTTPWLKRGKVEKPGHLPDTSTIRPRSTPKPAARSAALNSAGVIAVLRTREFIARDYNEKVAWRGHSAVQKAAGPVVRSGDAARLVISNSCESKRLEPRAPPHFMLRRT